MKPNITPLGLIVAALIICLLASLAVPRLREASRGEEVSGPPRVLATFEPAVSAGVGVVVTCGSCVPVRGARPHCGVTGSQYLPRKP